MMFTPIAIVCLLSSPTECSTLTAPPVETELACMDHQRRGVVELLAIPQIYVAGLACVETHLLDEAASTQ